MSYSDSDSACSEISDEPMGAKGGKKVAAEIRSEIVAMDPHYEDMRSVLTSGPLLGEPIRTSKVPATPWVSDEDTRKMTAEIDSVTEAIAREREEKLEATTAILGTQQQTTSKLAEVTFSMATLLEGLVADVQEMKKTFSHASRPMDSGCYPSPSIPVGSSSKYDQQGARPKQQLTTQNPGPIARPVRPPPGLEFDTEIESPLPGIHNASTEVQMGSPSHGAGYRPAGEVNLPRERVRLTKYSNRIRGRIDPTFLTDLSHQHLYQYDPELTKEREWYGKRSYYVINGVERGTKVK